MEVRMKREKMNRDEKSEKKLFGSKLEESKTIVELDDSALREVTAGINCGGIGIPN
jgi:hypothetical protein